MSGMVLRVIFTLKLVSANAQMQGETQQLSVAALTCRSGLSNLSYEFA